LPKNVEVERETIDVIDLVELSEDALQGMQVTKKELGRLKNKRALISTVNSRGDIGVGEPQPEKKRVRSEDEGVEDSDIVMAEK
jgi:hypothetical protein